MAINLPIISSLDPKGFEAAKKEFASLQGASEKTKFVFGKLAVPAAAALTTVAGLGYKAAQAASDLNEEISKSKQIFGPAAASIDKFSSKAAASLGQSRQEAMAAASTFGIMGQAAGLSGDQLATFSTDLVSLSSDLASFNNAKPQEVVDALGAALRGEAEPMRRFGVLLNDATLKAKAMEMGIYDGNGVLDQQAKILAANAIIFDQTKTAQGDFARTSDGAANKQRILNARIKDATAEIGQFFLPILDKALSVFASLASWLGRNTKLVAGLAFVIGGLAAGILAINGAIKVWNAATKAAAALQAVWNAALTANPIGLIVVGIAALVAGVVLAYRKFEGFRIVVNTVANAVIGYFEFMVNGWIKAINLFIGGINKFTGLFRKVGIPIKELGEIGEVSFGRLSTEGKKAGEASAAAARQFEESGKAAQTAAPELDKVSGGLGKVAEKAKEANDRLKEIRKTVAEDMSAALKDARGQLADAQQEFMSFGKTVGDAVTGAFSFSDAKKAGDETGQGFITALESQVLGVARYGELVNQLLAAGLSEDALQNVLSAGVEGGTAIATELLKSADNVLKANQLTQQVNDIAAAIGMNSANAYKKAGVDAATNLVNAIDETVKKYRLKLSSKGLTAKQAKRLASQFAVDVEFNFLTSGVGNLGVPALAEGGIVTGPTLALIGDNPGGREAVIPLNRGGFGNSYTIEVNAGVGNPVEIGREIVTAIKKYEKASGTGWRS